MGTFLDGRTARRFITLLTPLSLAGVLLLGWWVLSGDGPKPLANPSTEVERLPAFPEEEELATNEPVVREAGPPAPLGSARSVPSEPRAEEATLRPWQLHGEVQSPDGRGVGGVGLVLGEGSAALHLTSDATGAFSVFAPPGLEGKVLSVDDDDWVGLNWERAGSDPSRILVLPRAEVSGRIVRHSGEPVTHGVVHCVLAEHVAADLSDAQKVLRTSEVGSTGEFALTVPSAEGSALYYDGGRETAWRALKSGGERGILWRLAPPKQRPTAGIVGRVLSPEGVPRDGATVVLANRSTVTSEGGRFTLEVDRSALNPEDDLAAYEKGVGGVASPLDLTWLSSSDEGADPIECRMRSLRTVQFQLLWEDDRPVVGATVMLGRGCVRVGSAHPAPTLESLVVGEGETRTDEEGRVDVQVLAGGEYELDFLLPGRPVRCVAGVIRDQPGLQVLRLPAGRVIEGAVVRVIDRHGDPLKGVRVETQVRVDPSGPVSRLLTVDEGSTGSEGRFRLGPVMATGVTVLVHPSVGRMIARPLRVDAGGLMTVQVFDQVKLRIRWLSEFPDGTRLSIAGRDGDSLWFDLRSSTGTTPASDLPPRKPGSETLLLLDENSAWFVLSVPGEGDRRQALVAGPEGFADIEL